MYVHVAFHDNVWPPTAFNASVFWRQATGKFERLSVISQYVYDNLRPHLRNKFPEFTI